MTSRVLNLAAKASPVQVTTGQGEAKWQLVNLDSTYRIWFSENPNVQTNNGFPVEPLSSTPVKGNKPCYVVADASVPTGTVVQVIVSDDGHDYNNPVALAVAVSQKLLLTGLPITNPDTLAASNAAVLPSAGAIGTSVGSSVPVPPSAASIGTAVGSSVPVPPSASAIGTAVGGAVPVPPSASEIGTAVGSSVPVPPSAAAIGTAVAAPSASAIAGQIATQGVPIIQSSAHILSLSGATVGKTAPNAYQSAILDARQYESLNLTFKGIFDTAGDHWAVVIDWYGDAAGTYYLRSDMLTAFAGQDGMETAYACFPAQGNYVRVNVFTDGPNSNTFSLDLWGMTIGIPETVYAHPQGAKILCAHAGSIVAGASDVQFSPSSGAGNQIGYFHTAPGTTLMTVTIVALVYSSDASAGFRLPTIYTNSMPNSTEWISPLSVPAGSALRMTTQNTDGAAAHGVTNYIVDVT